MLELGMVSSFHPHSMCKRVERVTAKTGRTSCPNWAISFGVSGSRTRTHLLHGHFNVFYVNFYMFTPSLSPLTRSPPQSRPPLTSKLDALRVQTGQSLSEYQGFERELICYTGTSFFKLITTPDFFAFRTHHSKRRHQFSTLSDIICYFSVIYRFV